MSLRRILILVSATLAGIATFAAVGMIVTTRWMERATVELSDSTEGIRTAEESHRLLREYSRAQYFFNRTGEHQWADQRTKAHSDLLRNLAELRRYVDTPTEREVLDRIDGQVTAFLDRESETPVSISPEMAFRSYAREVEETDGIFGSIEEFVRINEQQIADARQKSRQVGRTANVCGVILAVLLLGAVGGTILFTRNYVYLPFQSLRKSIAEFSVGGTALRANHEASRAPAEIREIAAEFNALAARLEAQRARQQTFLAAVAHDLRNPIHAMKLAFAVSGRDRPMPPEFWQRHAALIKRQIGGLERMVSDLLDLALLESGRLKLSLHGADLSEIARHTVELFRPTAPAHSLEFRAPAEPVQIECDAARIEQVIGNLITNAIKYSPEGGPIDVSVERRGAEAVLTVADQGMGITPENQKLVFEPFCRIVSPDAVIPGVGLGLTTARMLIHAHGGRIELSSQVGSGTTFRVILPERQAVPNPHLPSENVQPAQPAQPAQ